MKLFTTGGWKIGIFIFVCRLSSISGAQVAPVSFEGEGVTTFDGWSALTSANFSGYGSFPGNSSWPSPIVANVIGSADAELLRLAGSPTGGGPFLSSGSIYFGNFAQISNALGGTLAVKDSTPLSAVRTIVLQVQVGEVLGFDFHDPTGYPVLKLNNSATAIPSSFSPVLVASFQSGSYESPATGEEPVYVNTWAFQWNLEAGTTVSSFQIEFSCVTHAQIYALQLDQSSDLQPQLTFAASEPPPQIQLVSRGVPEFSGLQTYITHSFLGPAGKTIDLEYSTDLAANLWATKLNVDTGQDGAFSVNFTASGDQRSLWSQRMFFRAKYSSP